MRTWRAIPLVVVTLLFALCSPAQNIITTVAGGGPDGVPAVSANLNTAIHVATDSLGNIFIADAGDRPRVFQVDAQGQLTIFAGNGLRGFSGDGGPATN